MFYTFDPYSRTSSKIPWNTSSTFSPWHDSATTLGPLHTRDRPCHIYSLRLESQYTYSKTTSHKNRSTSAPSTIAKEASHSLQAQQEDHFRSHVHRRQQDWFTSTKKTHQRRHRKRHLRAMANCCRRRQLHQPLDWCFPPSCHRRSSCHDGER
jgi:hypothetical protein